MSYINEYTNTLSNPIPNGFVEYGTTSVNNPFQLVSSGNVIFTQTTTNGLSTITGDNIQINVSGIYDLSMIFNFPYQDISSGQSFGYNMGFFINSPIEIISFNPGGWGQTNPSLPYTLWNTLNLNYQPLYANFTSFVGGDYFQEASQYCINIKFKVTSGENIQIPYYTNAAANITATGSYVLQLLTTT